MDLSMVLALKLELVQVNFMSEVLLGLEGLTSQKYIVMGDGQIRP